MVTLETIVNVRGVKAKDLYDFMLNCTDADYQKWWPGTHLIWHAVKEQPGDIGNIYYSEQIFGGHKDKGYYVVVKLIPRWEIVYQIKAGVKIPAWVILKFLDLDDGVKIVHTTQAGFNGIGKIFDPLFRLKLNDEFNAILDPHVVEEFQRLAEMLAKN